MLNSIKNIFKFILKQINWIIIILLSITIAQIFNIKQDLSYINKIIKPLALVTIETSDNCFDALSACEDTQYYCDKASSSCDEAESSCDQIYYNY